jgi:hypothetical protein
MSSRVISLGFGGGIVCPLLPVGTLFRHCVTAAIERFQRARAAYDAEEPPCPEGVLLGHHFENCRWLWRKHRLDELTDKCTSTDAAIRLTVAAILRARPQSLFGIAVKLSALPLHAEDDAQDSFETIGSVLEDIDRLVGSTFGTRFAEKYEVVPLNRDWQPEPEESGRLIVLS